MKHLIILNLFLLLALLFLASACATLDSSSMETAKTLPKGELKAIGYVGSQLSTHRMIYTDQLYPEDENEAEPTHLAMGMKLGVGVSNRAELDLSFCTANLYNLKGAFKYRLSDYDKTWQYALMPGAWHSMGYSEFNYPMNDYSPPNEAGFWNTGFELPFLVTVSPADYFSATGSAKLALNHIRYKQVDEDGIVDQGDYTSLITALTLTPQLRYKRFVFMPEVGVYAYPAKEGNFRLQPVWHVGLGMDWGD
ncbi:MAG TPA: hypothetical protein P5533_02770 [Candidatus Cloacimonadota bacterium]|nr:hypothetical protein [Candidatus Cloacimonadota bacterium]